MYYGQIIHENNKLQKFMCNIRIGMQNSSKLAEEAVFNEIYWGVTPVCAQGVGLFCKPRCGTGRVSQLLHGQSVS